MLAEQSRVWSKAAGSSQRPAVTNLDFSRPTNSPDTSAGLVFLIENSFFFCGHSAVRLRNGSYPLKEQLKHILKQIQFSKVPTNAAVREDALENLNLDC